MAKEEDASCKFVQPCLWARIGGSILFVMIGSVIPFTYGNVRQIDKNTQRIENLSNMQVELKNNTEAVIRLTVILEQQQLVIAEIKDALRKK